jgi:Fe-coproporphyrin III synthase
VNSLLNRARLFPFLLSNFRSAKPKHIDLELTNKCNLACNMCWFHGEQGIGDLYRGEELTSEEVFSFINKVAKYQSSIYLGGSEPFVRKDILSILEHIKKCKLSVSFTTNGTLLDANMDKNIVKLGIDQMFFSIDGDKKLHDQIRGKGVFRKVTSNIREIFKWKNKINSQKPLIAVNITITPFIIGHLQKSLEAIREATEDTVDYYRIHHSWYITPNELAVHQSLVNKYLKCFAPRAACHLSPASMNIDSLTLANEISQLKNHPKIQFFPNLHDNELHNYYSEAVLPQLKCLAPFYSVVIKPNGDVKFCPDEWIDDYVLGNIRQNSFEGIWNNKKARYFRSVIFRHNCLPGCKRCSWMYSLQSKKPLKEFIKTCLDQVASV